MTLHETVFFDDQNVCQLLKYHEPHPAIINHHHQKPTYLQERLWGEVRFGPSLWVCSNCHDAIHAWLYWIMGEHAEPPHVGIAAKAEAERTYAWYLTEQVAKGE